MSKLKPPLNKNDHIKGSPDATIEVVEFGDYQCPHCAAAHPVVKQLEKTLGNNLLFAFRHFPLSNIHPFALPAALAAVAAGRQHKFWPMHDLIFENQSILSEPALLEFANALRLDIPRFTTDIKDETIAAKVESDFESGVRSGVNGTPSFFINGLKYNGSYDYTSLLRGIEIVMEEMKHNTIS